MGYFTDYDEIVERIPTEARSLLSNDDPDSDDRVLIDEMINSSEEFILSTLNIRYDRDSMILIHPEPLPTIANDFTIYKLWKRKAPGDIPESIQKCYDQANYWLNEIKNGNQDLPGVAVLTNTIIKPRYKFDDRYYYYF